MAHHKSAKKRIRQNIKRNLRNRSLRANLRTKVKSFRELLETGNTEQIQKEYPSIQKAFDKAVTLGIMHSKTADRRKSRIMHAINKRLATVSS